MILARTGVNFGNAGTDRKLIEALRMKSSQQRWNRRFGRIIPPVFESRGNPGKTNSEKGRRRERTVADAFLLSISIMRNSLLIRIALW